MRGFCSVVSEKYHLGLRFCIYRRKRRILHKPADRFCIYRRKKVNPAQLQKTILHCVCVAYQKWLNCYFRILEWNIKIIHKKVELLFPHRKQLLRSRTINRTLYAGIPIPILRKLRMSKNQRSLLFLTWYNIPFLSF